MTAIAESFQEYDITVNGYNGPHCTFANRKGLAYLCDSIMRAYTNPEQRSELIKFYEEYKCRGGRGGVCDMTFFNHLFKLVGSPGDIRVGDTCQIRDNATFDHQLSRPDGFKMRSGFKYIQMSDGKPYGKLATTGEMVRFHALHMQGRCKRFMRCFVEERTIWKVIPAGRAIYMGIMHWYWTFVMKPATRLLGVCWKRYRY